LLVSPYLCSIFRCLFDPSLLHLGFLALSSFVSAHVLCWQRVMCGVTRYLSCMIRSPLLKSTYRSQHSLSAAILSYPSLVFREQTLFDNGTRQVTTLLLDTVLLS
jgi:hypothetical protein